MRKEKNGKPKVFIFDIETAPLTTYSWGLHAQYIDLAKLKTDWHFLSWAGKWHGDPEKKVIYMDNSKAKDITNDRKMIVGLWKYLDEADVVIGHNSNSFDLKKFNARAALHGLSPVSPYKTIDTYRESRKVFGFTSQKLDYLSHKLNKKYKKLHHNKYPGMELWKAVLNGDKQAWKDMKEYNIHDVMATEELYDTLLPWLNTPRMNAFIDDEMVRCPYCLSDKIILKGYVYTDYGKFQGYQCRNCNKRPRGRTNLYNQEQRRRFLK